jgi:hypothetical protein
MSNSKPARGAAPAAVVPVTVASLSAVLTRLNLQRRVPARVVVAAALAAWVAGAAAARVAVAQARPAPGPGRLFDDAGTRPAATAAGQPAPPPATAGSTAGVRRIVFVLDFAPADPAAAAAAKRDLAKAIDNLKPTQPFQVVAGVGARLASSSPTLTPATAEAKDAARAYLDTLTAAAGADLRPALDAAFAQRPTLVYLLTDGRSDLAAAAARLRELNRGRSAKVNVIAYLAPSAHTGAVQAIAQEQGGIYRIGTIAPAVPAAAPAAGGVPVAAAAVGSPADPGRAAFDAAVAKARSAVAEATAPAGKAYAAALQPPLDAAARGGDAAEASRLRAELAAAAAGGFPGGVVPPDAARPKSTAAVAARGTYDKAVARAVDAARPGVEAARDAFAKGLDAAARDAAAADDFAAAKRLRAVADDVRRQPADALLRRPGAAAAGGLAAEGAAAAASGPPFTAAPAAGRKIDLLPLVDLDRDVMSGRWRAADGGVSCGPEREYKRLRLPYRPPAEYDFAAEFTVAQTVEWGDVGLQCSGGNSRTFVWLLGGDRNAAFGFMSVGNKPFAENVTVVRRPGGLTPGVRYRAVARVRRDGVVGLLDREAVCQLRTDFTNVALHGSQSVGLDVLGLNAWNAVRWHKAEVTEVGDLGRPVRRLPAAEVGVTERPLPTPVGRAMSMVPMWARSLQVGYDRLRRNEATEGDKVTVDGKPCTAFLFAHAASALVYDVPPGAMGFRAVGVSAGTNADVKCYVYVDGNEAVISKTIRQAGGQVRIVLPLPPDAKTLELRFVAPGTETQAHSTWAYPEFVFAAGK